MPRAVAVKRLNALSFFLTYSQVTNFSLTDLNTFLNGKTPTWHEIGEEHHEDGGLHYHAIIAFPSRYQGTFDSFDLHGHHPNIKSIRPGAKSLYKTRNYIRKEDGNFASGGVPPAYAEEAVKFSWGDVLNESTDVDDFLRNMRDHFPKEYILRHFDLIAFAQKEYNRPSIYESPYDCESFLVPAAVNDWITEVFGTVRLAPRFRDALFLLV